MPETQNKEKIVKAPREESQMSSKGLSTRVALGSSNTRKERGDAFKTLRENYVPRELYVQPNIKHEGKIKIQSDTQGLQKSRAPCLRKQREEVLHRNEEVKEKRKAWDLGNVIPLGDEKGRAQRTAGQGTEGRKSSPVQQGRGTKGSGKSR